jgi:GH15 family glucan-1,4-alpha-glucosidase
MPHIVFKTLMQNLFQHSIALILAHQAPGGAYVASPNFDTYAYSWFRDGSFIAHAMDRVGEHASAARFHRWCSGVLARYTPKIEHLIARQHAGETITLQEQMHTRFTLDGQESTADWTNFQLDGYGTWLWALADHVARTGDHALYADLRPQVALLARYLAAFWQAPCYDCWEEFGDNIHTSTLAALYGGIHAIGAYDTTLEVQTLASDIKGFMLQHCVEHGHLVKFLGNDAVDASLLGAATPYRLLPHNDPRIVTTIAHIETDLLRGGVYRYLDDTYYGGGAWLLLTAWLGWYHAEAGNYEHAAELRDWVAAQATPDGALPEQVSGKLLAPDYYAPWVERWGEIATPLLWSHAMYLILETALNGVAPEGVAAQ